MNYSFVFFEENIDFSYSIADQQSNYEIPKGSRSGPTTKIWIFS